MFGYYDKSLLEYYPNPKEWQFRDEYPFEDSFLGADDFSKDGWEDIDLNDNVVNDSSKIRTPEDLKAEIERLKLNYNDSTIKSDLWERNEKI